MWRAKIFSSTPLSECGSDVFKRGNNPEKFFFGRCHNVLSSTVGVIEVSGRAPKLFKLEDEDHVRVGMTKSSSSWPRGVSWFPNVIRMWANYSSRPPGRHLARSQHLLQNFMNPEAGIACLLRAGYFCCGRVDPRLLPSTDDSCSVLPDLETRQMDPFLIRVLVKGTSQDSTSPGLSRMYISGVREGRTVLVGQQVGDLQEVFLGQRRAALLPTASSG
ncbi:hypothetical protein TNCV_3290221 [Trichonephila clavipes]|nr:hypothetical protein TNCV_3290221 [Trichonephila clavipes]